MDVQPIPVRVLIIDDNRDAADTLAYLLRLSPYEVRVAYDGESGLRVAREYAPDCVVSDISMPLMDGYAVARSLRSDPTFTNTKLVALTAYSGAEHARRAIEAGFDLRITKGGDIQELLEVLRMIEQIKSLAITTEELARRNVELAGQTKEILQEVKDDVREVKEAVQELKQEVKELKQEMGDKD